MVSGKREFCLKRTPKMKMTFELTPIQNVIFIFCNL